MENNLEYIDAYFSGALDTEQRKEFEQKLAADRNFAEEVAFYVSTRQVLKEELATEKKEWFRQLAAQPPAQSSSRKENSPNKVLIYRLAAAAALVGVIFLSWYLFFQKPSSPNDLADNYVKGNLETFSVEMGDQSDPLQQGLQLYNERKLNEALNKFEEIIQRDSSAFNAKKYAGIVYLRQSNYDKALQYFQQLGTDTTRFSNPSIFYQALTLMKRNAPGDKQQAKLLLQQVFDKALEGKETAGQWLKKL